MRHWNLQSGDPGSYTIAADFRFGKINVTNDHIWEITLEGGEPPALAIQTSFGLRARSFRIYPRFVESGNAILNPKDFSQPPTIKVVFPNYIEIHFSPLEGIDVKNAYWVPDSNVLLGKVQITNSRLKNRDICMQLSTQLSPAENGQRMVPIDFDSKTILGGQTGGIHPCVYMSGRSDTSAGPYPALSVDMALAPGGTRQFSWAHAALDSLEKSFQAVEANIKREWNFEAARIEIINQSQVEITTGDPDWDAVFLLSQKCVSNLLMDANQNLPNPTFVLNRQPDQGYSSLGDGSDYGYQWGGQTPLDTDYLSTFLLPSEPDMVKGFLDNFLETQSKSGYTDFQVGLVGQRGNFMATPILVNLTWRVYQSTQNVQFLKEVFPKLLSFIQAWFDKRQDRDGDGLPEWERSAQMGFEEHPLFSYWQPWSLGGDISKTESPSLCAFLYNEIQLLIKIAHILGETSPLASLEALADNLKSAVRTAWHESDHIYRNWDRESHFSTLGEILGEQSGSGEIFLNRKFQHPVRLVFKFLAKDELPNQVRLFIHGVSPSGSPRIERIETDQFRWHFNQGNVTSDVIYSELEFIEVVGPDQEDVIIVSVMDLYGIDQSLLLPLWAGIPEQERARLLVKNVIMNPDLFWKPSGISACVYESSDEDHPCAQIQMIWNNLIGEGMLRYGYRKEAAELVSKLMSTLIKNLKTSYSFFSSYHAISGAGIGDRNSLRGLAPIGLFLKTLGVHIISPIKIKLEGENPFPWEVTIKYKGLTVIREKGKTKITFPGGQTAVITSEKPRVVTLEPEHEQNAFLS